MKQTIRREIGLVVGVERFDEPPWHQMGEFGESPAIVMINANSR